MKICLQGGAEFGADCREMDKAVLRRAGGGPVVVLPLAVGPQAYDSLGRRAVEWYVALGATSATVAPDPRIDADACREALVGARLVVIPGGSPHRLHEDLRATGIAEAVADAARSGAVLTGSSAGGMVLCDLFSDPEAPGDGLVPGLGLVPRCVLLPHYESGLRPRWLGSVPEGVTVLGVEEGGGALVSGEQVTALGAHRTRIIELGRTVAVLDPGTTRDVWWDSLAGAGA